MLLKTKKFPKKRSKRNLNQVVNYILYKGYYLSLGEFKGKPFRVEEGIELLTLGKEKETKLCFSRRVEGDLFP